MNAQAALKRNIPSEELAHVVVRIAGDSGDGIQVTGTQFTHETALAGSDLATLPNFPAEIRAPAGTLAGVSGFQIQFGSTEIFTPGDAPDVLVALNPAALKANLHDLPPGGALILNEDAFHEKNLSKVGYTTNPCEDESLKAKFRVYVVPVSRLTKDALADSGLSSREVERCKNFFTLGIILWMFNRSAERTERWIAEKYKKTPELVAANKKVLQAGMTFGEATEIFDTSYTVKKAKLEPGTYKTINGTQALTYALVAASLKSELPLFFGAYPITPASELLHELSRHRALGVSTFQAEDEIAAICSAIGASYAGALGVTCSSGPGISLKAEAMGLAVSTELPLVVINVQRAGPSTGLPTKTEQADLLQAMYGRHGEAPMCVLAASSPSSAFTLLYDACRIAVKYMTPVIFLSDGYIANCSEPWKVPDPAALPEFSFNRPEEFCPTGTPFLPFKRNEETLARSWATPGTAGYTHRIGGLEKEAGTGNINYEPANHALMCKLRADKIERISQDIPELEVDGEETGDVLVVGWGGTEGTLIQATKVAREKGIKVSRIHIHHINPFPKNLEKVLKSFRRVLLPEINHGQLKTLLRDKFLVPVEGFNIMRGEPLKVADVVEEIVARGAK